MVHVFTAQNTIYLTKVPLDIKAFWMMECIATRSTVETKKTLPLTDYYLGGTRHRDQTKDYKFQP